MGTSSTKHKEPRDPPAPRSPAEFHRTGRKSKRSSMAALNNYKPIDGIRVDPTFALPNELMVAILSMLEPRHLGRLCSANTVYRELASADVLWKCLCKHKFSSFSAAEFEFDPTLSTPTAGVNPPSAKRLVVEEGEVCSTGHSPAQAWKRRFHFLSQCVFRWDLDCETAFNVKGAVISPDRLQVQSDATFWYTVMGDRGFSKGRTYWEVSIQNEAPKELGLHEWLLVGFAPNRPTVRGLHPGGGHRGVMFNICDQAVWEANTWNYDLTRARALNSNRVTQLGVLLDMGPNDEEQQEEEAAGEVVAAGRNSRTTSMDIDHPGGGGGGGRGGGGSSPPPPKKQIRITFFMNGKISNDYTCQKEYDKVWPCVAYTVPKITVTLQPWARLPDHLWKHLLEDRKKAAKT